MNFCGWLVLEAMLYIDSELAGEPSLLYVYDN